MAARPIPPLISAHLIMKDEAEYLPRCLASLQGVVDEICIVDTGSTDDSIAIAQSFGARVIQRPWTDSFSEARNACLDAASGRWILQIDADEELHPEDGERLRQLLLTSDLEGYLVDVLSYEGEERPDALARHTVLRIWRNRPHYRFRGRIHEGLQLGPLEPHQLMSSGLRLFHYGYLSRVHAKKQKSDRNLNLLLWELQDEPDSPYWHFYLATEYMNRKEHERALEHFDAAARRTPPQTAFAPLLVSRRILTVQVLGRHERALELIAQAEQLYPDYVDLRFLRGESLFRLGRVREALQTFQTCVEMGRREGATSEHLGVESYKALWWIGHLNERLGSTEEALAAYRAALRTAPHFRPACVRLVELLRQRHPLERAVAEVPVADTDAHRMMVAEVFRDRGDFPAVPRLLGTAAKPGADARNLLLGSSYIRMGEFQKGLRILEEAERDGLREQVQFERVLAAWLAGDENAARQLLSAWRQVGQQPRADGWEASADGADHLLLCLAIQAFRDGDSVSAPEQVEAGQREALMDALRAFYACGPRDGLNTLERFALARFGAGMAGQIAALYAEARWSTVWPTPAPALLQILADLTRSDMALPPEEWVSLARLFLRHGRFHEAMHCYQEALQLDTCWVSTYLEAAEALHRRALHISR